MLLGSRRYDEKVDIWSIGCLLAQFYLRRPPFFAYQFHAATNSNNNNNKNNRQEAAVQHMNT